MDTTNLKTIIDDAQAIVFMKHVDIEANPDAWIDSAKETIALLISNVHILLTEIPCSNCDGNGFVLGTTDGPEKRKNRPCKVCTGTGQKYNKVLD
jgi:hypothetical protein